MTEKLTWKYLFYTLLIVSTFSCQTEESKSEFVLLDSLSTGVDFENTLVESDSFNIIQYLYFYNGAGVGTGDFNNDGYPDIFFAANQQAPQLYLNKGQQDISFSNVSDESGLQSISGWSTGVAIVDINRDGLLDVYLCQVGNYKTFRGTNRLLINQGLNNEGIPTFVDKAKQYGLQYSGLSTQAAFFDYDLDGDLDMYLLNHSVHRTSNYGKAILREEFNDQYGDRLYVNENNKFINITQEAEIFGSRIGYGLGIAISDIDQNGFPDIYIGNDFHENDYLYLNQGDGTFRETIRESTGHTSQFTMGVDIADINDDGLSDIMTLDMKPHDPIIKQTTISHDPNSIFNFKHQLGYHHQYPKNNLQLNQGLNHSGIPVFAEISSLANVDATDWSWSTLIEDFNNDGAKDIFVTNGIVRRPNDLDYLNYIANEKVQLEATDLQLASKMPTGEQSNYFFFNNNDYQFSKIQIDDDYGISTGASYADFDLDGDLDIVTNNINGKSFIYENQSTKNYIQLKFDHTSELSTGAKVIVETNGKKYYRELNPYRGFMSSVDPTVTIGLGDETKIDSLKIIWPDGYRQLLENVDINQRLSISKNQGNIFPKIRNRRITLFTQSSIPGLKFVHKEDGRKTEHYSSLQLLDYEKLGPCTATTDLNKDGISDIYFGNARHARGGLYISNTSGSFNNILFDTISNGTFYEDISSHFMDIDGDSDMDLIVGHVTSQFDGVAVRYYVNNGNNSFEKKVDPVFIENPTVIVPADFDQDGDVDYFLGSGYSARSDSGPSALMLNDGAGKFKRFGTSIENLGQVTDATWGDVDGDNDLDLIIVSEWKPITILINKENGFSKRTIKDSEGLWKSIALSDLDRDGDLDFVAGNIGLNSSIAASTLDPILRRHVPSRSDSKFHPIVYSANNSLLQSTGEIVKRIPALKKELHNYKDFADYLFSEEFKAKTSLLGKVAELKSTIFYNDGNANFKAVPLPIEAQFSSIHAICIDDLNQDGLVDLLLGGNEYGYTSSIGRHDASHGLVCFQDKDGTFKSLQASETGLYVDGMIRTIVPLENGSYLFGINNSASKIFKLNELFAF